MSFKFKFPISFPTYLGSKGFSSTIPSVSEYNIYYQEYLKIELMNIAAYPVIIAEIGKDLIIKSSL